MSIDGFNYKHLANTFAEQAFDLLPKDVSKKNAQYIKNIIGNFSLLAGEAVSNQDDFQFDNEKATFLVQLLAEWSFHKAIDLSRSKIPETIGMGFCKKLLLLFMKLLNRRLKEKSIRVIL